MKQFVFLYPADRKFECFIKNASYPPPRWLQDELRIKEKLAKVVGEDEREGILEEGLKESQVRFRNFYSG